MSIKTCIDCFTAFEAASPRRQLCDDCRLKRIRKRAREWDRLHPRKKKRKRQKEAPATVIYTIPELNTLARQQGLSYGQMVAKMKH